MINEVSEASDGVLVMTLKGEHVVSTILSSQVSSMNETEEKMRYLPSLLKYVPPTIISGVRGIGPNSGVPLGKLTCLTKEEIRCAVMSNVFIVPYVRINTVIWDNWDIFYRRKYIWTVVRSRPGSVKILLPFPELRFLLCEPTGENGNYRAVILSKWGRPRVLLASGSLKEALDACEDKIDDIRYKYEIFVNEANLEIKETYRDDIYLLPMKKAQSITMFQDKRYKFAFKHWYLGMLSLEMVPKAPDFFSNGDRKPIYLNDDLYDNDDYVDFVSEVNKITNEFKINTFRGYRGDWYWNQADYSSHVAIQFIEDIGSFEEKFFKYDCHGFVLGKKNWSKDEKDKFLFFYKNIMQQFFSMREIYVEESLDLLSVSDMKLILTSISRSYIEVDIENAYINLRKKYTRKKSPTKEETKLLEEELKEEKATISKISLDFGILKYIEELKVKSI